VRPLATTCRLGGIGRLQSLFSAIGREAELLEKHSVPAQCIAYQFLIRDDLEIQFQLWIPAEIAAPIRRELAARIDGAAVDGMRYIANDVTKGRGFTACAFDRSAMPVLECAGADIAHLIVHLRQWAAIEAVSVGPLEFHHHERSCRVPSFPESQGSIEYGQQVRSGP
jgi:hypothetical protein